MGHTFLFLRMFHNFFFENWTFYKCIVASLGILTPTPHQIVYLFSDLVGSFSEVHFSLQREASDVDPEWVQP